MNTLLLLLVAGAIGGNLLHLVHRSLRRLDLAVAGNVLAGLAGGGFGGALARALHLAGGGGPLDLPVFALAGLLGGAAAVALIAWARNLMAR